MATINGTENDSKKGFLKLAITMDDGTKVTKIIPSGVVDTEVKSKSYLKFLEIQNSHPVKIKEQ